MSALMFIRDGRTLPFVPVTTAALVAIAAVTPTRRLAYARSLYLALLEFANEARDDRVAVTRKDLYERSGVSRELISDLRPVLEEAGVVQVHERTHGGQQIQHEWVVIEPQTQPGIPDPRASQAHPPVPVGHDPRASQAHQTQEGEEQQPPDEAARASERVDLDAFPEDLPESLHAVAVAAGKILKKTALERGQKLEVTRAAVGHAVLTFPDRDHVQVAREVEGWLLHGRGSRKSCADIVARYRNFLQNADPMAGPPLPGGGSGGNGGGGGGRRESASDLLRALREGKDDG